MSWIGLKYSWHCPQDRQWCDESEGWAYTCGAGPTWGITLYDRQVVQLEGRIATTAGEPNYVVLPVVDKLGALLDVDIVSADIKHYSNVAFVLRRRRGMTTFYQMCKGQDITSFMSFGYAQQSVCDQVFVY